MILRIHRDRLPDHARNRAPGFIDAVSSTGVWDGDVLVIDRDIWRKIADLHRLAPRPSAFGLGDAVAAVAQLIAGLIDAVAGTNIKNCGGCAQRKEALNRLVPRL